MHTEDEVMVATDIIKNEMNQTELVEVTVLVDQIVASSGLKNLSPTRRKCLYDHESKLYFDVLLYISLSNNLLMLQSCSRFTPLIYVKLTVV